MSAMPNPTPTTLVDQALEALRLAVESFDINPLAARRAIASLLGAGSPALFSTAVAMIREPRRTPAYRCLLDVLIENERLLEAICDRNQLTVPEAAELVKGLSQSEPLLDVKMLRNLLERMAKDEGDSTAILVRELLAVYDHAGLGSRLMTLFVQLLRKQDVQIRSKVALLVGRASKQVAWAIADRDPRVRANAIESLWGVNTNSAKTILWKAVRDCHQRVAGNALLGLLLIGERGAEDEVKRMARQGSAEFRASMAWVMGQSKTRGFLSLLEEMTKDAAENVRLNASKAIALIESCPLEAIEAGAGAPANGTHGKTAKDRAVLGKDRKSPGGDTAYTPVRGHFQDRRIFQYGR
jgi:HEAT repeat protein